MNRKRLFVENFLVYGLAGVIGKVIPFVMLPIITRLIPDTSIYGLSDILKVFISFGSAFAGLGVYDAMFRMFFEKENEEFQKKVCLTALNIVLISSTVLSLFFIVFSKTISTVFFATDKYFLWIMFCGFQIFFQSLDSIISAPTRMQNKRKVYLYLSVFTPVIGYAVSVPLIIFLDPLIGLMVGGLASVLLKLFVFWVLNKNWFLRAKFDRHLSSELLKIGLPLVPVFLVYWIYSSFDRIMITNIMGSENNGIYAIGSKLSIISQLLYLAFSGGGQYFHFATMKAKDQVGLISKTFYYATLFFFTSYIFITPYAKLIYEILFVGEYVKGYLVAPYLFLSPCLLIMIQTLGGQLMVVKKTAWIPILSFLGAAMNVSLNFLLIPILGIEGAAISTVIGYTINLFLLMVVVSKKKLLIITKDFYIISFLTCIFLIMNYFFRGHMTLYLFSLAILFIIFILNKSIFLTIFHLVRAKKK